MQPAEIVDAQRQDNCLLCCRTAPIPPTRARECMDILGRSTALLPRTLHMLRSAR